MRFSKNKNTVGITLRIEVETLKEYERLAAVATKLQRDSGVHGVVTAQDVMRDRLNLAIKKTLVNENKDI